MKTEYASKFWHDEEKEMESGVLEGITDNYIRVQKKGPAKLIRSIEKEVLSLDNVVWNL